jgi:hypothetical protein
MTAVEVLHDLQVRDIRLTVDGEQLRYDAPEDAITEEVLRCLRQYKAALLTLLQRPPDAPPPPAVDAHAASLPLGSPARLRDTCYACGTTRRWRSIHGAVVCGTCHPPADTQLVAEWASGQRRGSLQRSGHSGDDHQHEQKRPGEAPLMPMDA